MLFSCKKHINQTSSLYVLCTTYCHHSCFTIVLEHSSGHLVIHLGIGNSGSIQVVFCQRCCCIFHCLNSSLCAPANNGFWTDPLVHGFFFSELKFIFQVQAVLLLLGRGELPPGLAGMVLPNQNENKVCTNWSAAYMTIILSLSYV